MFLGNDVANNNGFFMRNAYPTATGPTTATYAGSMQGGGGGGVQQRGGMAPGAGAAAAPGADPQIANIGGNPVIGGLVFFGLVFALMFLAKYLGTAEDDFKSLKPSIYNVVVIALAAAAGLPLLKYAAYQTKIPGVSTWILAA